MTEVVLGLTRPSAPYLAGLHLEDVDEETALLMTDGVTASSPRERLRHCVRFHAMFPALLPFAMRSEVARQSARDFARSNSAAISQHLRRAERFVALHITVPLTASQGSKRHPVGSGREWLRARQSETYTATHLREQLEAWALRISSRVGGTGNVIEGSGSAATVAVEIATEEFDILRKKLLGAIINDTPVGVNPASLLATGPWPLFSFQRI